MKTIFTGRELPHIWASQAQDNGRTSNGNMFFAGSVIYSYGSHFPIACFVTDKAASACVLFTSRDYSNTTGWHKSRVRWAIKDSVPVFTVELRSADLPNGGTDRPRWDKAKLGQWASDYERKLAELKVKAARATGHAMSIVQQHDTIRAEAEAFCKWFKIRRTFAHIDAAVVVRAELKRGEHEDKQAVKRARDREQWDRIAAENQIDAAEKLTRWLSGENVTINYGIGGGNTAYLRIEGSELVTSMGARVPVDHAWRVLKIVRELKARGETYKSNGHTIHIGPYTLDEVDSEGNVKAGCHVITWSEIERITPLLAAAVEAVSNG